VLQLLKLPDGAVKVLVEGGQRAKVVKYTDCNGYYEAEAVVLVDTMGERVEAKALARVATAEFENYAKLNKKVPPEVVGVVQQIEDHAKLADTIASHLALKIPDQQAILETFEGGARQGDPRAQEAQADIADGPGKHRRAQLPRLVAVDPME
jgi:ATP-dependent Lon protease